MPIVSSDVVEAIRTNFRALFFTDFEAAQKAQLWRDLVTEIPSETEIESYNWLGTVPQMKEWLDERQEEGLLPFKYDLRNKDWEATIAVDRNAIEDNKLGIYRPKIAQLALEAARHPGELVFKLFTDNPLAFDGVAFFADARVIGISANIDNLLAGTGVTVPALQTDLGTVRAAMQLFQDDKARPMSFTPDTIVCPAALEQAFWQALNAILLTTSPGMSQPGVVPANGGQAAGYRVIVNPYLTDTNDWYALYTKGAIKPFLFQNRRKPDFTALDRPDSEQVFKRKKFLYGVDARYIAGVTDPRMAIKVTNT